MGLIEPSDARWKLCTIWHLLHHMGGWDDSRSLLAMAPITLANCIDALMAAGGLLRTTRPSPTARLIANRAPKAESC